MVLVPEKIEPDVRELDAEITDGLVDRICRQHGTGSNKTGTLWKRSKARRCKKTGEEKVW